MSLSVIIAIMLFAGILGGVINWLMPANIDPITKQKINSAWKCILLGVGATILVPLFLEIAKSELLNNVSCSSFCIEKNTVSSATKDPLKNYFLFAGYCLLAAVAGIRFIQSLMDSVIKDKKIEKLEKEVVNEKREKETVVEEKAQIESEKERMESEKGKIEAVKNKYAEHSRLGAERDEEKALAKVAPLTDLSENAIAKQIDFIKPGIGPVIHPDDPQKGRFGGKSINNNRALKARVTQSWVPGFYTVSIWVESTDQATYPLNSDVIFYIHDSFRPSVYTVSTQEFKNGIAIGEDILAYGAFTVGAVTDQGNTLLELDLAEQQEFPETFRER